MLKEEVRLEFAREPFVPLRLYLKSGKTFNVPFREMSHILGYGVLVFIGMKQGSRSAKGYDRFHFEDILRIERLPPKKTGSRRRKAS